MATKEQVYDEQISPLMDRIIALCYEHKIPLVSSFGLDREEGLVCGTFIVKEEFEPPDAFYHAANVLRGGMPQLSVVVRDDDGRVDTIEVSEGDL